MSILYDIVFLPDKGYSKVYGTELIRFRSGLPAQTETADMARSKKNTVINLPAHTRKKRIIIGSVITVLIVFRLFLPTIVLRYVNNTLGEMKEYTGHVEDIDIALIRGAYVINDIKIVKIENKYAKGDTLPFFSCKAIDLSVEWGAIFKGAFVAEVVLNEPRLNFVKEPLKAVDKDLKGDTADFRQLVDDLLPLTINRFQIKNAQVHYINSLSRPVVELTAFNVLAKNLSNGKRPTFAIELFHAQKKEQLTINIPAEKLEKNAATNAGIWQTSVHVLQNALVAKD